MDKKPKIAPAEWFVMKALWTRSPQTAHEVVASLADEVEWSPRTIKTHLNRLLKKGVIDFVLSGQTYLYRPAVDEATCVRHESQSFLKRVYGGETSPMLAHFIEHEDLSREELSELRRMIDEREGKDFVAFEAIVFAEQRAVAPISWGILSFVGGGRSAVSVQRRALAKSDVRRV